MTIHRSATFDDAHFCDCYCPDEPGETQPPIEMKAGRTTCTACKLPVLSDELEAEVKELARRWSYIHSEIENEGFDRQARVEDGADDYSEGLSDAEYAGAQMARQLRERTRQSELETIEEMLAERGARMMRPYEHWNEDERYMSWAEGEG